MFMLLLSIFLVSTARAETVQLQQGISEAQVKELHDALESYYLACGFYPSSLSDLLRPIAAKDCKGAPPDAMLTDTAGSRAKLFRFMVYRPKKSTEGRKGFQNYEINFRILQSRERAP